MPKVFSGEAFDEIAFHGSGNVLFCDCQPEAVPGLVAMPGEEKKLPLARLLVRGFKDPLIIGGRQEPLAGAKHRCHSSGPL